MRVLNSTLWDPSLYDVAQFIKFSMLQITAELTINKTTMIENNASTKQIKGEIN